MRKNLANPPRIFPALRATGLTKLNEDIVVPRGRLEDLFRFTARLQKKIKLPIACFGHAGDGNIHVNIMLDKNDSAAVKRAEAALDELFRQVLAWNGAITGEHGIGLAKKRWWPLAVSKEVARTASRRETNARPERHFESGEICLNVAHYATRPFRNSRT